MKSTNGDGESRGEEDAPILLTEAEAAELLRITPRTMENLRLGKRGPRHIRLAAVGVGKVVYDLRDIQRWLAESTKRSSS